MTTVNQRTHLPAVVLPVWAGPAILGILLGLALLFLRVDGLAAPDLTVPLSPFFVPGGPDLHATTA